MFMTSRILFLFQAALVFALFTSQAKAECPAFPQVAWWGKLNHENVKNYVLKKHGGEWADYLDKWKRQLASVKAIHDKGQGIKIPKTKQVIKGEALSDYIDKLALRVEVNQCLSQEKLEAKATTPKKATTKKKKLTPYGRGLEAYKARNYELAREIWLPAATEGNANAQNAMGLLYRRGLGVDADIEKAREWYAKSAANRNAIGQFNLGTLTRKSARTKDESLKAIKLFILSARQNYAPAQFALADMNQKGEGVSANDKEAYFWAILATKNKYKKAKALHDELNSSLAEPDKQAQAARAEKWLAERK